MKKKIFFWKKKSLPILEPVPEEENTCTGPSVVFAHVFFSKKVALFLKSVESDDFFN